MLLNIDQQNEVLHHPDVQRVCITASHHPLYGQSLKVIREIHFAQGDLQLVVELPNGHTQLIAARWTTTAPTSLHREKGEVILFSSASLRSLVIIVASLTQQPEACNGIDQNDRTVDDFQGGAPTTTDPFVDRTPVPPTASSAVAADDRRQL
jgi:hypothetical protein